MDEFMQQLRDAHNEVMEAVAINATDIFQGPGVIQGIKDFTDAVEWEKEPVFKYLAAFHVLVWLVTIFWGRRSSNRIMGMMVFIFGCVFGSSTLNTWGKDNYQLLFPNTQTNYFDEGGVFISALWSGPMLVLAFLLQVQLLFTLAKMMIVVKRGQVAAEAKKRGKAEGPATTTTPSPTGKGKRSKAKAE